MSAINPTVDTEWNILLAACSATPSQTKQSRLQILLQEPVRWKSLLALAYRHGTQPLLYQALLAVEDAVPHEELATLKQSCQINLHKTLLLSRELIRIVQHLAAIGIAVFPYKGLALAERLYGDITLRPAGDIDLLIQPHDLPRVGKAVGELGYTPHAPLSEVEERAYLKSGYECTFDSAEARNLLEVQWGILPRFYGIDFDMAGIFKRTVEVKIGGYPIRTLSDTDSLLVLSAHAAKHVWDRLVWLCDIARLMQLPGLDWDAISGQARDLGMTRILWITMLVASRLLAVEVPAGARASLPADSGTKTLASEIRARITSEAAYELESWSYFRLMMRLREHSVDRLRFLGRLIFTPGPSEWRAVRLPRPLFPLYRLVRLSRLAARVIRT
jgi:hypothetical protein